MREWRAAAAAAVGNDDVRPARERSGRPLGYGFGVLGYERIVFEAGSSKDVLSFIRFCENDQSALWSEFR